MLFDREYEVAVSRSHETHGIDEYLVWRSPSFNAQLRWIARCAVLISTLFALILAGGSAIGITIWTFVVMFLGVWRLLSPLTKTHHGYTITSKRIIVFRLNSIALLGRQTSYKLSDFHAPVIERNLIWRRYGDLRFDRASRNPASWRNSRIVKAISFVFESVRIRDDKNPEVVAGLIRQDMSIEWGAA